MQYRYTTQSVRDPKNFNRALPRKPLIDLEILGGEVPLRIGYALIDSGADASVFNVEYANAAGIDLSNAQEEQIMGIGNTITGYRTEVKIKIDSLEPCTIPVWFVDSPNVNALLGQEGFFDLHKICFNRAAGTFEVTLRRK